MKYLIRIYKTSRIMMAIVLLIYVALVLVSCEQAPLIGEDIQAVKAQIEEQGKSIKEIYEYSFFQPKDHVIDIKEEKDQSIVYISMGLPDIYKDEKNPLSHVSEINDHVYYVNNKFTYVCEYYNGNISELDIQKCAYFFEVYDDKAVYMTESQPQNLYVKDMSTGEIIIPINNLEVVTRIKSGSEDTYEIPESDHIVIVNGHLYYINSDGYLQRCSLFGSESTILIDEKVKIVQYLSGWVYYVNSKNQLCRISCDGNQKEVIIKDESVDDYCFGDNCIFYKTDLLIIKKYDFQNQEVIVNLDNKLNDITLDIIGYIDGSLYIKSQETIFEIVIDNGTMNVLEENVDSLLYHPRKIDDWIYYYKVYNGKAVKFVRSNVKISETEILGREYEAVIEYF